MRRLGRRPPRWHGLEGAMSIRKADESSPIGEELGAAEDATRASGSFPTASHRELGISHERLLADMARRGEDPATEAAWFDTIEQDLRARRSAAGMPSPMKPRLVSGPLPRRALDRTPVIETDGAGGASSALGSVALRPAELADLFGDQDWAAVAIAVATGAAMLGDQIKDGDAVLVDTRRRPKDGDIVLASVAGRGQLVRRYRRDASGAQRLESSNPSVPPIDIADPAALTVHGVVVARAGRV
jgi:SOS-response transcriptional repressor LexA